MNAKNLAGLIIVAIALAAVNEAQAQGGFGNRDRLFMVYNSINNQRNQRQLYQQQQQLQGQFNQFARQQSMMSNRMMNVPDPIEQFVRQAEGQSVGRGYIPPIYSGANRSRFGGHLRYFNP